MKDISVRVLLVEDDEDDYIITRELLSDSQGTPFEPGCSEEVFRILGIPPQEHKMSTNAVREIFHPDDVGKVIRRGRRLTVTPSCRSAQAAVKQELSAGSET